MNNNLLVVSTRFPHKYDEASSSFVYNMVNSQKKRYDNIVVLSATPFTPSVLGPFLKASRKRDAKARDYNYDNVSVHFLKNIYLPFNIGYKFRGHQGFRKAQGIIKDLGIQFKYIHGHFSWPTGEICRNLSQQMKIPFFLTIHENRDWLVSESSYSYIEKVWREANGLVRVNKIDLDLLRTYNENVIYIPNGFDNSLYSNIDKFSSRKKLSLGENECIIYTLGNLIPRKGFLNLLKGFKIMTKSHDNVKLFIGGTGPQESELKSYINSNNLTNCKLLGYIPNEDLPYWMHASDIFALTSFSEGNPTVMFEALGSGKPVVYTKVGGVPEILMSENYGFLVENDPYDIAKALSVAVDKFWDNQKIKSYGSNFTWEKIESETFDFFTAQSLKVEIR